MRFVVPAAACLFALSSVPASAAAIIYSVNQPVGAVGLVTGTITTDGSTGVIGAGNITAWNLNVAGNGASTVLNNGNSNVFGSGGALSATLTQLSFNFSDSIPSYLLFQVNYSSGTQYFCAASTPFSSTPCYQGLSAVPVSYNDPSAQYSGQGSEGFLSGSYTIGTAVPEPATWAMMLVGFGMIGFGLRSRRRQSVRVTYA